MTLLPTTCEIFDFAAGSECTADYVKLEQTTAKVRIDRDWWIGTDGNLIKRTDGDTWSWAQIAGEARVSKWAEVVAVVTPDSEIQGAIAYRTDGLSKLENGKGAVYVQAVACAPRNRRWIVDPPKYCGVGTSLLLYSACHSYILGLGGRVLLVSLPNERTQAFYEKMGFTRVEELANGMIVFELGAVNASTWLLQQGLIR